MQDRTKIKKKTQLNLFYYLLNIIRISFLLVRNISLRLMILIIYYVCTYLARVSFHLYVPANILSRAILRYTFYLYCVCACSLEMLLVIITYWLIYGRSSDIIWIHIRSLDRPIFVSCATLASHRAIESTVIITVINVESSYTRAYSGLQIEYHKISLIN